MTPDEIEDLKYLTMKLYEEGTEEYRDTAASRSFTASRRHMEIGGKMVVVMMVQGEENIRRLDEQSTPANEPNPPADIKR